MDVYHICYQMDQIFAVMLGCVLFYSNSVCVYCYVYLHYFNDLALYLRNKKSNFVTLGIILHSCAL